MIGVCLFFTLRRCYRAIRQRNANMRDRARGQEPPEDDNMAEMANFDAARQRNLPERVVRNDVPDPLNARDLNPMTNNRGAEVVTEEGAPVFQVCHSMIWDVS